MKDRSVAAMAARAIRPADGFREACRLAEAMGGSYSEDGHEEGSSFYFPVDGSALLIEEEGVVPTVLSSGEANVAWLAEMDTSNFAFSAFGATMDEATGNLRQTLIKHGEQYGLDENWFCENRGFCKIIEMSVRKVYLSSGLRDREILHQEDSSFEPCVRTGYFLAEGGADLS